MAFLTWFIDQLALYKYNQFQLYVEHAFAFGELSEAWRGTDPLTADDIMFWTNTAHTTASNWCRPWPLSGTCI